MSEELEITLEANQLLHLYCLENLIRAEYNTSFRIIALLNTDLITSLHKYTKIYREHWVSVITILFKIRKCIRKYGRVWNVNKQFFLILYFFKCVGIMSVCPSEFKRMLARRDCSNLRAFTVRSL